MFDFIINASLKQRLIVLGVSLLLVIYGALTVRQMPVDVCLLYTSPSPRD